MKHTEIRPSDDICYVIKKRERDILNQISCSSSRTAKSITKEGNKLKADGNTVTAFGAVIVPFHTIIGGVVAAAGGVTYLIGDYQVRSMSTVKENTNCVIKMDFKWTYTKSYPLKGTFRIKSYYTYKGKTVGEVKTYYQNRQFALGERW